MLNIKDKNDTFAARLWNTTSAAAPRQSAPAAAQLCFLNSHEAGRIGTKFPNGSCSVSLRGQPGEKRKLDSKRKKKKNHVVL